MKRSLLIITFILTSLAATLRAQPYGNEWIDYTQEHYKISITADGMYRIPYSTLNAAIPNLSALNVGSFIMYHNLSLIHI